MGVLAKLKNRVMGRRTSTTTSTTTTTSYAQFGEDVIIDYYFKYLNYQHPNYLDIGAFDPIELSNTYRLYQNGSRGVLVEPIAERARKIRATRPRDTVLDCAIRTSDMPAEVEFYVMTAQTLSTIVKREAVYAETSRAWGEQHIADVRRVPALTINEVLERHFKDGVDIIDIDIEGLDLEVLREIDYERFRPRLVMVEIGGGHYADQKGGYSVTYETFIDFMATKGYRLLVPIVLNGIFVRDQ
jgi:FkbM family methyltransferase